MGFDIKEVAKTTIEELFDRGHPSFLSDVSELSFVGHEPTCESAVSLGQEEQIAGGFRGGFPDLRCTVEDVVGEGDRAVCRWRMTGTHRGPFLGIPPTGNRVAFEGITLMRFNGTRLAEEWTQYDCLRLLSQLGVVPRLREVAGPWPTPRGEAGVGV